MNFNNPLDPENIQLLAAIKGWVKDYYALEETTGIIINEHNCADAACPDKMVKIAFEKDNSMQVLEIRKPMVFIRKRDIAAVSSISMV